jgi:hypothetical protein
LFCPLNEIVSLKLNDMKPIINCPQCGAEINLDKAYALRLEKVIISDREMVWKTKADALHRQLDELKEINRSLQQHLDKIMNNNK